MNDHDQFQCLILWVGHSLAIPANVLQFVHIEPTTDSTDSDDDDDGVEIRQLSDISATWLVSPPANTIAVASVVSGFADTLRLHPSVTVSPRKSNVTRVQASLMAKDLLLSNGADAVDPEMVD